MINTLLEKRKNGGKHVGVALLPVAVLMLVLATGVLSSLHLTGLFGKLIMVSVL